MYVVGLDWNWRCYVNHGFQYRHKNEHRHAYRERDTLYSLALPTERPWEKQALKAMYMRYFQIWKAGKEPLSESYKPNYPKVPES